MEFLYMLAFFAGLLLFFGTHYYTAFRARDENSLAVRLGRPAYIGLYSLLTLVGFVALVWGYGMLKPWIPLATPPYWTRHITMALMLPAMILIVAAYMRPAGFLKKAVKHPMLLAVKIWALAHLIANWDLASFILFGSFLIYGVVDRIAVKRRGDMGAATIKPNVLGDLLSIAVGLALYLLLIYELHYLLIGVDVLEG